jgi:hypothetical protein
MTPDEVSAKQASKKIDKELEKSRNEAQKEVKLLLLGTTPPTKPTIHHFLTPFHLRVVSCHLLSCVIAAAD